MFIWTSYVDVLRALLFVFAHLFGGSTGGAIIAVSCIVRLALMPLALRIARRGLETQAKLRELEPRLATLRRRHADDPARLYAETRELHRKHGIRLMSGGTVLNLAVQIPVATGLYQAIGSAAGRAGRFLWAADLARPDALVAVAAAAASALAALTAPAGGSTARVMALVSGAMTLAIAWRLSAGLGLYWGASSAVGVVQSVLMRRASRPTAAA